MEAKLLGYGMDFGYTNDPTTIVAAYEWNGQRIYDEVAYQTGLLNGDIAAILKANGVTRNDNIYADSADPKSIDEINRYGFTVKPVTKGQDSIAYGIGLMQGRPFFITKRSTNAAKEFNAYCWDTDKDGNTMNRPIDAHNHFIDAARYIEMMSKLGKAGRVKVRTFG
jgi:phage terminase large subunit